MRSCAPDPRMTGATQNKRALQPSEPLHVKHEHRRAPHLNLDGKWHKELGRLGERRSGIHVLAATAGMLADQRDDLVDAGVVDAGDDGGVALLEKAAGGAEAGGHEPGVAERVAGLGGVVGVDDGNDELHRAGTASSSSARRGDTTSQTRCETSTAAPEASTTTNRLGSAAASST